MERGVRKLLKEEKVVKAFTGENLPDYEWVYIDRGEGEREGRKESEKK